MPHRNQRQLTQQLFGNNNSLSRSLFLGSSHLPQRSLLGPPLPPLPPAPTAPPLITDTLTACLDLNGTYFCTSYSPRCYIIQKVTPNSVTVTPAAASRTAGPGPSTGFAGNLGRQSGSRGGKYPHHHTQGSNRIQGPPIPQPHHVNVGKAGGISLGSSSLQSAPLNVKIPHGHSGFEKSASITSGGVYMNGEIGSSVGPVGETGMPTMVYPQPVTALAPPPGTHFSDPHGINGVIMSQEYGIGGESADTVEHVDGVEKRVFNSDAGQAQAQSGHTPDIPIEELKRMLLSQLEYYFSPENLASDKFLVSQMDSDHYVYISTLANFNMIKKLTSNIDLVTEVLRESKNVQVHPDLKRVRPVSHRTVVILRGIAASTSPDEIKLLFENDNCPKCTGCEFAFNDSWYVSFESDDDAMQAHRYLREDVREFNGHPIMARIKSKPTTLLSQGVGIGVPTMKNGYNQTGAVMQPYMTTSPAFVPANQQTGAATAPTPLYAPGQQVPNVFTLPANYPGFNPWAGAGYYDINSGGITPMFSMNGLQPQPSPGYPKSGQMNPRPRNLNPMRGVGPRRTISSGNDTQSSGVVVGASGSSNNGPTGLSSHQPQPPYNSQPPRKNNGAGAPAPLLGMAPQASLVSHPPPTHTSHHHQSHHPPHNSLPQNSANQNQTSNGRNYNSYSQSVPHNISENYHYSGSSRPYRGGGDQRPRSSLSSRRGPPRRDEDGAYDYNPPTPNASSNYRGNPSNRTVPPAAVSPQIPAQVSVSNQNHQIDLDLEGSAFPPLPGSANASSKNGDSPYEGRLSDVVKGVKNIRTGGGSTDKEDSSNEIVVSAAEPGSIVGSPGEVVVSAASPKEDEGVGNRISEHHSSHGHPFGSKKEYREIGVGGADEANDIRSSQSRNSVVSGMRQTADKSTRTDENLLNGDQSSGGSSRSSQSNEGSSGGGYRKSVASQGGGSKSPIPAKRGVPPFQTQTASMGVGTEVPYSSSSSSNRTLVSPVSSSSAPAKPPFVTPSSSAQAGRGAITSNSSNVAKTHHPDNNRTGTSGIGSTPATIATAVSGGGSHLNTTDKDAFPTPNFVKSVVPSPANAKPFSGLTDHNPKEVTRNDDERKESGQGDAKKIEDCSMEDREGPVRLSYAQVAQSRKDAAPPVQAQASLSPSNSSTQQGSSSPNSSSSGAQQSAQEERKRAPRDTKDTRAQSKTLRGSGDRDRDRDRDRESNRGYRRGYRSRVTSDASDTGSNAGGNGKPPPRGPRSPK